MSTVEIYTVIAANQESFPVTALCERLGVSRSGYLEWRGRAPSDREQSDAELLERIRAIHTDSDATYGMPRVRAELADQGIVASRKRVARLMRAAGLRGVCRRRGWTVTTRREPRARPAPDLVERDFTADAPDRLWVADMTYVPTWAGFVYLAVVLDVFSRRRGRLVGRRDDGDGVGDRGARPGARAASSGLGDPPLRSGLPIHGSGVRPALRPDGGAPVDGLGRGLLR